MATSVRPEPIATDDEAEFQAWLRARPKNARTRAPLPPRNAKPSRAPLPGTATDDEAEYQAWLRSQSAGAILPSPSGREHSSQGASVGANEGIPDAPLAQRIAETVVSGFPGARRAVAGYRGLLSLLSGEGLSNAANEVEAALSSQRQHVDAMPALARVPLQLIGGAPAASVVAPLGLVGGGAAFGAAEGADRSASSLGERATNALTGAATGAVAAKGSQLVGRGVANLSNRVGLTDLLNKAISKVNPSVASTIGTRGQVNQVLSDRQDILDVLGDHGSTAAKTQMARMAATKSKARELYNLARRDNNGISDPELIEMLADPQIQKAYQAAAELRAASGNPLPRTPAPATAPLALQKMGVSPERYAELQAIGSARSRVPVLSGTDILPPELMGQPSKGIEMPDPEVLSRVKRYLYDAARGRQDSPLSINQDEARALLPKVTAIRDKLHEVSPAWKRADAFFSHAKGEEEAFAHGFDAFRLSKNPQGAQLATHSPEAMLAAIEEPRYRGEPTAAMAARAKAFRDGVQAAARAEIRGAPVDRGLRSVLGTNALAPTESAQQTRALGFDAPQAASNLEQMLARYRGNLPSGIAGGDGHVQSTTLTGMLRSTLRKATAAPDLLQRPEGQGLIAELLGNPSRQAQSLQAFRKGQSYRAPLQRYAGISAGSAASR